MSFSTPTKESLDGMCRLQVGKQHNSRLKMRKSTTNKSENADQRKNLIKCKLLLYPRAKRASVQPLVGSRQPSNRQ